MRLFGTPRILLVLFAVLLALGLPVQADEIAHGLADLTAVAGPGASGDPCAERAPGEAHTADDGCPDKDSTCPSDEEHDGSCCDLDLCGCCHVSLAAAVRDAQGPPETPAAAHVPVEHGAIARHLMHPRDNGPPPTPPPIG